MSSLMTDPLLVRFLGRRVGSSCPPPVSSMLCNLDNLWRFWPARCSYCLNIRRRQGVVSKADLVVIGIFVGVAHGILIAALIFFRIKNWLRHKHRL